MRSSSPLRAASAVTAVCVVLTALGAVAPLSATAAGTAPATTGAAATASVPSLAAAKPARKPAKRAAPYRVRNGVAFNSATGSEKSKYAINDRIKGAIVHAVPRSSVSVMSWNLMSRAATSALLAAQRRGVTVRVLMDSSNWSRKVPNPQFKRLKSGLAAGNKRRGHYGYSAAKVCSHSCRGSGGQAHAKFYLFSQTGSSTNVTMQGSANFTLAAATNQWNDLYTYSSPTFYRFALGIFNEDWADRPVSSPYRSVAAGPKTLSFGPSYGAGFPGHAVSTTLNSISCRGASNGNTKGRTVVRIFPDVMRGSRGLSDARRLKQLWDGGCDVRVGYTVLSRDAYAVLRGSGGRGAVPMRHMAIDRNRDGQFDRYFHLKVLAVRGIVGGRNGVWRVVNGSSNLSGASTVSDENIGTHSDRATVQRYVEHLDYWFDHAPGASRLVTAPQLRAAAVSPAGATALLARIAAPAQDPTAGADYIAPGTEVVDPQTGSLVDPYAEIEGD